VLRALLAKDLRRARRNPLPWLLNLALPLMITAVIGLVFGSGSSGDNSLGRIKFAVVDEDKSALADFLRGAANQGKAAQYLEPVFLEAEEADKQLKDDKLSAILVIPPHFASNYLTGQKVQLELVKNPAEQIHPAVLEELLEVVVSALNAISRNFNAEFPAWRQAFEGQGDYHEISKLIDQTGDKLHAAREYLFPPLVTFTNTTEEAKTAASAAPTSPSSTPGAEAKPAPKFNLFAYLLVGLAGMFLLMLANQGMNDLHREVWKRTFERYNTLHENLLPFVMGKALFTIVIVSIGAAIMLVGGQWLFHFRWPRPLDLGLLTLAYICFATGLMAVTVAIMPDERRANALNNVLSMILSMAGGCMFPPDQLPAAMRDHISPLLPTYWFATSARQLWWSDGSWLVPAAKLAVLGAACLALAAFLFKRRFEKGAR
jgi:ABC-type multidrug transport system permease subunit